MSNFGGEQSVWSEACLSAVFAMEKQSMLVMSAPIAVSDITLGCPNLEERRKKKHDSWSQTLELESMRNEENWRIQYNATTIYTRGESLISYEIIETSVLVER